jgi:hypothetical protein
VQPIAEIAAIARSAGVLMHTDAAQSVKKIPTRVNELRVDLLSVAGHKLYAPKGVGASSSAEARGLSRSCTAPGTSRGGEPERRTCCWTWVSAPRARWRVVDRDADREGSFETVSRRV